MISSNYSFENSLKTFLKWMMIYHILVGSIIVLTIYDWRIQIYLATPVLIISICFYLLGKNKIKAIGLLIGYGIPAISFVGMILHKKVIGPSNIDITHYYSTGIYLQILALIPFFIYKKHGGLFLSNVIFVLLLIVLREPINRKLGIGISSVTDAARDYYAFDILMVLSLSLFLIYLYFKGQIISRVYYSNLQLKSSLDEHKFYKRILDLDLMRIDPQTKIQAFLRIATDVFKSENIFITEIGVDGKISIKHKTSSSFDDLFNENHNLVQDITNHVNKNVIINQNLADVPQLNSSLKEKLDGMGLIGESIYFNREIYGAIFIVTPPGIDNHSEIIMTYLHNLVVHISAEMLKEHTHIELIKNRELALIAKETTEAIVVTDTLGNITWVNQGFVRITGYEFNEIIGKRLGSFLQGPESQKAAIQKLKRAMKAGTNCHVQLINYRKSGEKYWIDVRMSPITNHLGEVVKFIAIETEITELYELNKKIQQESERLQLAIEAGKLLAFEMDLATNSVFFIPHGSEKSFFDIEDNITNISGLMSVIDENQREVCLNKLSNSDGTLFECELQTITSKLKEQHKHVRLQSFEFDMKGNPTKLTGIFRDITDEKLAESDLISAQENERLRVGREIHDGIGQMLVGMRLLLNEYFEKRDDGILPHLDEMFNQTIREARLIVGNLSESFIQHMSLKTSIESLVSKLRRVGKCKIEINILGEERMTDPATSIEIFRIVQEALSNAIKHAEATLIIIELKFKKEGLKLMIKDNGLGFVHDESKNVGFGMKNMQIRAENINGQLTIRSVKNKGTSIQLIKYYLTDLSDLK